MTLCWCFIYITALNLNCLWNYGAPLWKILIVLIICTQLTHKSFVITDHTNYVEYMGYYHFFFQCILAPSNGYKCLVPSRGSQSGFVCAEYQGKGWLIGSGQINLSVCVFQNETYKTYRTGFLFCCLGHFIGVRLGGAWGSKPYFRPSIWLLYYRLLNHWTKSNQI